MKFFNGCKGCLTFLALLGWLNQPPSPAKDSTGESVVPLVIIAGQSNAVGFDTLTGELAADTADARIDFWWRCGDPPPDEHDSTSGGKWTHLQPQPRGNPLSSGDRQYGNFHYPEGGFGPEFGLARTLFHQDGKPLAVIKVAWSGTSLAADWNAVREDGLCYQALLRELKTAMIAAQARGIHLRPRAFVWVQGESDATSADAPRYAASLKAMLAGLRKELNTPDLPAFLGLNTRFGATSGGPVMPMVAAVVQAQKAVASSDKRCVYVNTEGAELANGAHFDSAGTLEVGRRYARAILDYERMPVVGK